MNIFGAITNPLRGLIRQIPVVGDTLDDIAGGVENVVNAPTNMLQGLLGPMLGGNMQTQQQPGGGGYYSGGGGGGGILSDPTTILLIGGGAVVLLLVLKR